MSRDLHHIAKLNALPEHESELDGENGGMSADQLEDYSVFSNTTFYDFDIGRSTNIATTVDELLMAQERQVQYPGKVQSRDNGNGSGSIPNANSHGGANAGPSYSSSFDFPLHEFSLAGELPPVNFPLSSNGDPTSQQRAAMLNDPHNGLNSHRPSLHHISPALTPIESISTNIPRKISAHDSLNGLNSDSGSGSSELNGFDSPDTPATRQAAEEDKRRRNTAASARFRIKKKLREQEMERNARDMQRRIDQLESRVKQLEMENRLLKNLAGERSEARDLSTLEDLRSRMLGTLSVKAEDKSLH